MIFSLDHIVFSTTAVERAQLAAELEAHGFEAEEFTLEFPDSGVGSDSWSFAGGGFVELVSERVPGGTGLPWFDRAPCVIGLGFASNAFEADTGWDGLDGAWQMDEHHTLPNGADLRIHAAGPHEHLSEFYVFVMDRADGQLEFPSRTTGPRLRRITLVGSEAESWRRNLGSWLAIAPQDGALRVGDVVLSFETSSAPALRATLHYESDLPDSTRARLAAGAITITPTQA